MRQILEYSNEPVTISSLRDHTLREVNAAFLERTGYTREEVVGRSSLDLRLWEDESIYESIWEELRANGAIRHRTIKYRSKNGDLRSANFSAAIRDFDGEPTVISFITDVTDATRAQEELRRSERRFRSYIEHASDGLTVLGRGGVITFASPSVERLLGFAPEELVGKNYRDLVHPDDLVIVASGISALRNSGGSAALVFRVRHRSGRWVFVEGTSTILPESEDEPRQTVVNWRDITQRKVDEERLHTVERRLRDIVNHEQIVVTEYDERGTIIMAEGSGIRVTPGAVGNSMFDLFADAPKITSLLEQVLSGEPVSAKAQLQGRWFDVWGEPVLAEDGSVRGGISVSTEVTHRVLAEQNLEREKEQFRVLVDNASDLIMMMGRDGTILFASPSVEKLTGHRVEEVVRRDTFELLHPDDVPLAAKAAGDAFGNPDSNFSVRFRIQRKGGELRRFEARGKVLPGAPDRMIIELRDVTEQESYEAELACARDAALESSRLKSAFLAAMSHEIRTPLNVLLGYVDVIADHLAEISDDSQKEYLDSAARAGKRLIRTINGILDYSKIEAGGLECKPEVLNLSDLAARYVEDFRALANRKGIDLRFVDEAAGACIMADEYCVSAALQSLIGNAIKFTERGSVQVRQFLGRGDLCLEVRDSGIGIDAKFLPKMFQPFMQEDSGFSRKFEGSGLGLALTRCFLDANHASITLKSEKGAGATFTIHFTTQHNPTNGEAARHKANGSASLPKLLVVEDDPDTQTMMRILLQNAFDLRVAASGDAVRNIIAEDSAFEGVLMDISLKGAEDGLQITRFLRCQPRLRTVPIIAVTAHASIEHQRMALESGCDAVLTKPVKRAQILSVLAETRRSTSIPSLLH